jgi:hypothetical protein
MHGRRSLNLELTPLDLDLERNIRRARRARGEMGDNQRSPRVEEHGQNPRNENMEMREVEMGSTNKRTSWISLHHSGNCSHPLQSVSIRA